MTNDTMERIIDVVADAIVERVIKKVTEAMEQRFTTHADVVQLIEEHAPDNSKFVTERDLDNAIDDYIRNNIDYAEKDDILDDDEVRTIVAEELPELLSRVVLTMREA